MSTSYSFLMDNAQWMLGNLTHLVLSSLNKGCIVTGRHYGALWFEWRTHSWNRKETRLSFPCLERSYQQTRGDNKILSSLFKNSVRAAVQVSLLASSPRPKTVSISSVISSHFSCKYAHIVLITSPRCNVQHAETNSTEPWEVTRNVNKLKKNKATSQTVVMKCDCPAQHQTMAFIKPGSDQLPGLSHHSISSQLW